MTAYKVVKDKDSHIKEPGGREFGVLLGKSEELQLILFPWAGLRVGKVFVAHLLGICKKFSFKSICLDEAFWGRNRTW